MTRAAIRAEHERRYRTAVATYLESHGHVTLRQVAERTGMTEGEVSKHLTQYFNTRRRAA